MMQELWEIVLDGAVGCRHRTGSGAANAPCIPTPSPAWLPCFVHVPPTNSFSVSPSRCWLLLPAAKNN